MKFTAVILALSAVAALAQADVTAPAKNAVNTVKTITDPATQSLPGVPQVDLLKREIAIPLKTSGLQLKRRGASASAAVSVNAEAAVAASVKIAASLVAQVQAKATVALQAALKAVVDVDAKANANILADIKADITAAIGVACKGLKVDVGAIAHATIGATIDADADALADIQADILAAVHAKATLEVNAVVAAIDVKGLVAHISTIKGVVVKAGVNGLLNLNVNLGAIVDVVVESTLTATVDATIEACVGVAVNTL